MCLAVPGRIEVVEDPDGDPLFRRAEVTFGGVRQTVSLACTPEAVSGDWVLVHAGLAIAVIDEAAAAETLALFEAAEPPEAPA